MRDDFAVVSACLRAEEKESAAKGLSERSRKFLRRIEHPENTEDPEDDERIHVAFPVTEIALHVEAPKVTSDLIGVGN